MTRPLPSFSAAARMPQLPLQIERLANGLRVFVVERRGLPIVDLHLVFPHGAEIDAPASAGRVSMMAEMLDEGTSSRGALDIAEAFDYLGAHFDVQAGYDALSLSLHVLSSRLPEALDLLSDVVLNATFPVSEFRRKQEERLDGLQQDLDEAAIVATKTLARGIFGAAHAYGAPLGGTVRSIEALQVDQLRALYERTFRTREGFVVLVGDVAAAEVAAQLESTLGTIGPPQDEPLPLTGIVPAQPRRVLLVPKPGAAQAELRVGHAGPARNTDDYFALVVLNTILGGSFTSRLNTILRERMGVTYGASSRFRLRRHGGLFSAGSAVFTEAAVRSARVVVDEMERMAAERVPADELQRAQNYLALGLPRQFETTEDIAAHLREQVLHGLPAEFWQTYVERIFAVTADAIRAAAARHLQPGGCTITIVADPAPVQPALAKEQLGEVVIADVEP